MALVGCGGGGSGIATPTATPRPGATGTPTPTATNNGSGPITSNQLVFVSTRSGSSEIYKANTDGTNAIRLTHFAGTVYQPIEKPSVSPDGRRILFQYGSPRVTATAANSSANLEIAVINTDGTGLIKLTDDKTDVGRPDDYSPVFSADNKFIFWTSERSIGGGDQQPHIWRMNGAVGAEATGQGQFISEQSSSPSINRAGNTLAYIAIAQTSFPITLQPLSGNTLSGTAQRIGGNVSGGAAFNLALSPDGTRAAFSSVMSGTASGSMGAVTPATAQINVLNVSTGASAGTVSAGMSNSGSAWSRDSQTLYFDAGSGTGADHQLFSLASPFTGTPRQLTTSAQGLNYSPSFLSGG